MLLFILWQGLLNNFFLLKTFFKLATWGNAFLIFFKALNEEIIYFPFDQVKINFANFGDKKKTHFAFSFWRLFFKVKGRHLQSFKNINLLGSL